MVEAAPIQEVKVSAYQVPTGTQEADGTLEWSSTTLVLVEISAANQLGIGYSYADTATARLIQDKLGPLLLKTDGLATAARHQDLVRAIRNLGRPGICSMALSAVDTALWDLKGRLLDAPVATLLGAARQSIPVYGSGGFTSYDEHQLRDQMRGWIDQGVAMVKMKVGREPSGDLARVQAARDAIGSEAELFVDANGAYSRKQALAMAEGFAENGVTWFEEPVSSDDLAGLQLMCQRAPAGMNISAGEYGYDLPYFRRILESQAVDVLQADITRCGGVTGFLGVASLCQAHGIPLSCHCAPALHVQTACAAVPVVHLEYFHDHVRIEQQFFDGLPRLDQGRLVPDLASPGLGLHFKHKDAQAYAI